jgi:geranylgeranyl pyrophosphate synthase
MLRQKYRYGGITQKSEEDIERMVTAATNIINRTPNPIQNASTVLNYPTVLSQIAQVANNLSNGEVNNMDVENNATDNAAVSSGASSLAPIDLMEVD